MLSFHMQNIYCMHVYIYRHIRRSVLWRNQEYLWIQLPNPLLKNCFTLYILPTCLSVLSINTLRSQKCLERKCLKTFKHQNTFKHNVSKFSASQSMNIPLNPTPGFGNPKHPPWETWKNSSISPKTGGRLEPLATRRQPGNPLWWLKARARRALRIPGWLALEMNNKSVVLICKLYDRCVYIIVELQYVTYYIYIYIYYSHICSIQ